MLFSIAPQHPRRIKKPLGLFHQFDPVLRDAIVITAMRDAPETRILNKEAMEQQVAGRQAKEKLAKEKNLTQSTDQYIEGTYLIQMHSSDKCEKDDPLLVTSMLKKLGLETAK